jgi:hypothetical protein
MNERKNIDRFFKDHLEDFEVAPPELAWENIEAQLNEKKKKRRIIPFWWKVSGVAAILFLGFGLLTTVFNNSPNNPNTTVNQQNTIRTKNKTPDTLKSFDTKNKESISSDVNTVTKLNITKTETPRTSIKKNTTNTHLSGNALQHKTIVSVSNNRKRISNYDKKQSTLTEFKSDTKTPIATNTTNTSYDTKNNTFTEDKTAGTIKPVTASDAIISKTIIQTNADKTSDNAITNSDKNNINNNRITNPAFLENTDKKIVEIKKIDSTKMANIEPNALEELLNEKEKKIVKEQKLNRWQVTPNIAPIYFSSMSNGSPLDEKLAANEKVYGANYSYGLGVNYAVNKKLHIRSGVNTFSADYDTKGIIFYQNTSASRMQNVTPNLQGSLIQIDPLNNVTPSFGRIIEDKFEGTLNQRMSYIEVPFEASYKILSKKFGIDLIGGMSTLFLNDNDVFLKTPGFTMKIGEANNLNKVHFSTNIGLGLKYSFLKRFDARVEPLFKYQINTYSSGAGDFKPYVFGVYSGISYHF